MLLFVANCLCVVDCSLWFAVACCYTCFIVVLVTDVLCRCGVACLRCVVWSEVPCVVSVVAVCVVRGLWMIVAWCCSLFVVVFRCLLLLYAVGRCCLFDVGCFLLDACCFVFCLMLSLVVDC